MKSDRHTQQPDPGRAQGFNFDAEHKRARFEHDVQQLKSAARPNVSTTQQPIAQRATATGQSKEPAMANPAPKTTVNGIRHQPFFNDQKDVAKFSIRRALLAAVTPNDPSVGYERSCAVELAKREGRPLDSNAILIPDQVVVRATSQLGTGTGVHVAAQQHVATQALKPLIPTLALEQMGISVWSDLAAAAVHVPVAGDIGVAQDRDELEAADDTEQTWDNVSLTPRRKVAMLSFSRELLTNSSPNVEKLLEATLFGRLAILRETTLLAAIDDESTLLQLGDNGISQDVLEELIARVDDNGALAEHCAFLSSRRVAGRGKGTTRIASGSDVPLLVKDGKWHAYDDVPFFHSAFVDRELPLASSPSIEGHNLVFIGNLANVILGLHGSTQVITDPYTGSATGAVRMIADQQMSVGLLRPDISIFRTPINLG